MSETTAGLLKKIDGAEDLHSVVRTMKAVAAINIGQYEKSTKALVDYYRTVELGLGACFRELGPVLKENQKKSGPPRGVVAIVFGSDQGLVGQFNDQISEMAAEILASFSQKAEVWAIGERIHDRLKDNGVSPKGLFSVPNSVKAIAPLVGEILLAIQNENLDVNNIEMHLIYNQPKSGVVYSPVDQKLLPLDQKWRQDLLQFSWPTGNSAEIIGGSLATLRSLIREYLFVSLFKASADSLASENASRLAAMQRAEKNINELLEELKQTEHRLRQSQIDEELFDLISGFEALREE